MRCYRAGKNCPLMLDDLLVTGERTQWKADPKRGYYTNVHQNVAIDELKEMNFEKHLKDDVQLCDAYLSVTARRTSVLVGLENDVV